MSDWNPETTPNFNIAELACKCGKCGGQCEMKQSHMDLLQSMRGMLGPLSVSSGYRCPQHPEEVKKAVPGAHGQGTATDIKVTGAGHRFQVMNVSFKVGMVGICAYDTFIHVDSGHDTMPRPALWVK